MRTEGRPFERRGICLSGDMTRMMIHRIRRFSLLAWTLGWCAIAASGFSQSVDEDDVQELRAATRPAEGNRGAEVSKAAAMIVEQTNDFRAREGLKEVEVDAELSKTAQYFAQYMAKTDRYGHTADNKRPIERARGHGYEPCIVTENIAYQYSSAGFETEELAEQFVKGWKQSPGHRRNMLDADVTEIGVAVARSSDTGHYYAVQMFGRPRSQRIEFQIENESGMVVEYEVGERSYRLPPRYTRTHQICRPAKLTFDVPDREGRIATTRPGTGDRFVVVRENGEIHIQSK